MMRMAIALSMATFLPPTASGIECAQCHPKQAAAHAKTLMAQTLEPAATARLLRANPKLEFTLDRFRYLIENGTYTVSDGTRSLSLPIRWGMGQGDAGQTYILEHDGKFIESRVSFYNDIRKLGLTIGAPPGTPATLEQAVGREMSKADVIGCFGCHTAPGPKSASVAKGTLEWTATLKPGVQCENCHADATRHAANPAARPASLKNSTAEEMSDLCGVCHRTWADIAANGPRGLANVRFQPYRLAKSKCYNAADARISCTACHDSHERPAGVATPSTDRACAACHNSTAQTHARSCGAAKTSDCASCHMPKFSLPGAHYQFTDHRIRIVRNKNEYPD